MTTSTGEMYVGDFRDGKYHGQGTLTYPDGTKYVGEFRDGKAHGQGSTYRKDGTVERSGTWIDGARAQSFDTARGSAEELKAFVRTSRGLIGTINFLPPSLTLDGSSQATLAQIKATHNGRDSLVIEGTGYRAGSREWNLAIGQRIADEVKDALVVLGLPAGMIEAVSMGREYLSSIDSTQSIQSYPRPPDPPQSSAPKALQQDRVAAPSALELSRREEVEAARRRQQELEQKLATESRERERLAADAELARRRQRELEGQLEAERKRRVAAEAQRKDPPSSTGTGFSIAPGALVTNQHVVAGCKRLEILSADGRRAARVVDADELVDLALLRVTGLGGGVAPVRRVGGVRLGEPAYAFGFPLTGLLSETGSFTGGTVSSLRGLRDSANQIQISTPVQPGNSGGALADASGSVIGVVVGKLNAGAVARVTGDIPQNVNFAVSLQALSDFLRRNNVPVRTVDRGAALDTAQLADVMRGFTHRVECLDQR